MMQGMKKIYLYTLICTLGMSSCNPFTQENKESPKIHHTVSSEIFSKNLSDEQRAQLAKNRIKQIREIRKGDYFTMKNNPDQGLAYYLSVAEKLPDDTVIAKKIAHVYFLKKDWKNAFAFYKKVPLSELKDEEKKEMTTSLFFDETQLDRIGAINQIFTNPEDREYYRMVNDCYGGIHVCTQWLSAYTGSNESIRILKNLISESEKISPDISFRNFWLAVRFYEQKMYRLSEKFARDILEGKPDYDEVKKLLGFSLAELGRYHEAKTILIQYAETHPKEYQTIVKLWEITAALGEYAQSNLYLNNAILAGVTPKTELERRLAHNYALLSDTTGMMKVLGYLMQEPDVTEDDAAVAISLALAQGENVRAYSWAELALKKYPKSRIVSWLYLTSLRLMGRGEDGLRFLWELPEDMRTTPIILLEEWILLYERGELDEADSRFEKVLEIDPDADFSLEAQNYRTMIENDKNTEKSWSGSESSHWWF
jgi:tetratricopeptide (TPR) repeat protein